MMAVLGVLSILGFVAGVCLMIAATWIRRGTLELRHRSQEKPQEAPARPDGECVHDWTLWTQPEESTVTLGSWYGDNMQRPALVQTKTCLKCNMHERRIC